MNKYGETITYSFELLKATDYNKLQAFKCGNKQLDHHIKSTLIKQNEIVDEDALYFKFTNTATGEIIAIAALATSGILFKVPPYSNMLPALKIDVFAVDEGYQKLHYNIDSEQTCISDEHYYFSDDLLCRLIGHCNKIAEQYALANYVIVYADQNAVRYYERNKFCIFNKYMEQDHNMEIIQNIPMYLNLNN